MKRKIFFVGFLAAGLIAHETAWALDYKALLNKAADAAGVSTKTTLSSTKIGAGLKEALRVGIDKAVQITSKKDGYLTNENIKILMPDPLRKMDPLLRKMGMGPKLDEFVLSMNRAAEKAAPAARDFFIDALMNMSVEDAQKIYQGGDTAATQYFKSKTSTQLAQAYKPIMQKALKDYGVTSQYQALMAKVPLAGNIQSLNVENHAVNKAIDGMFTVLGEQEKAIRHDPAARVTSLLKEVFGSKAAGLSTPA